MAAPTLYSKYQQEYAEALVTRAKFWTRATRKRDGLAFVIFPSSLGRDSAYYTTETGCTCRGFASRGRCSHQLAVKIEAEAAREAFCAPTERYDEDESLRWAF